jgi:hypothetical protein
VEGRAVPIYQNSPPSRLPSVYRWKLAGKEKSQTKDKFLVQSLESVDQAQCNSDNIGKEKFLLQQKEGCVYPRQNITLKNN